MKKIIDLQTWERRDNFSFFRGFLNPFISVTSEVECGAALEAARASGQSFFLHYLYAALRAANEIEQLRYRFWGPDDRVVLYGRVDVLTPVRVPGKDVFYSVRIPYEEDFARFHASARAIIDAIPADGDPYAVQREPEGHTPDYDVILLSAIPGLSFTAMTCTQKHRNGCDFPLVNVGRAVRRDGRLVMPVAISFHHGFADGVHIADFFRRVGAYLSGR